MVFGSVELFAINFISRSPFGRSCLEFKGQNIFRPSLELNPNVCESRMSLTLILQVIASVMTSHPFFG